MHDLPSLPVGLQDFERLRTSKRLYVDKTAFIFNLLEHGSFFFFLSRPRRFGKSLLISTLKSLFEGKKALFEGLYIYDKIEWQTYPIIHLDFSNMDFQGNGLREAISETLKGVASQYDVELTKQTIGSMFAELMHSLHQTTGNKVVILIDEYDKPITDVLEVGKNEKTHQHRDILRELYAVVKGNSAHIRFFFMTGIAKFSKVSIFSDLNNLTDLSMERDFQYLLGYTQQEIESYFEAHLKFIAQERETTVEDILAQMKDWYNGFSWNGRDYVYNPYSILRFLSAREFSNFWFDSGNPKFLINKLKDEFVYDVSQTYTTPTSTQDFDIDHLSLITLFFQTGYLTVKEVDDLGFYLLDYPNKEVELSMLEYILIAYAERNDGRVVASNIIRALRQHDMESLITAINQLFAAIPYQTFDQHREKYFHAILFLAFKLCGFHVEAEVSVSKGRLDAVLCYQNRIYIFEFKLDDSAQNAINQIKEKEYFKKYTSSDKEIYLLGINFSSQTKEVREWEIAGV